MGIKLLSGHVKQILIFLTDFTTFSQVLKDETSTISDLGTKIRLDNADYADRVAELQKVRCPGWLLDLINVVL